MLYKISEFNVETLSISNTKDATYLQADKQAFELQQIGSHLANILYLRKSLLLIMLNR